MKLSAVYKSPRKADTYLYVAARDDFSKVPDALLSHFGKPQFVTMLALSKHETIAHIAVDDFIKKILETGFYLQLPPKEKSLLDEHRASLGLEPIQKKA